MALFWKAVASVSDDVRHELVEKAWFGRQVTSDIDQQDMPGIAPNSAEPIGNFYGVTRAEEPSTAGLWGRQVVEPNPQPEITGPEPEL